MATLKQFIEAVNKIIQDDELTAIAGASNIAEAELTDEGLTRINEKLGGFLTKESAMNNVEIRDALKKEFYPLHKKTFLGNIDNHLSENVSVLFGDDKVTELDSIESTEDKIKRVIEWTKVLKKSKSNDEDLKKSLQTYQDKLEQSQKLHETALSEKDKEIVSLKNGHNQALVKSEFNRLTNSYELAEAYKLDGVKKAILDNIYTEINAKATLKLHPELGSISLYEKSDANVELYEGSKRIEIKDKLDSMMEPYLAKKPEVEKEKFRFDDKKPIEKQTGLSSLASDMKNRNKNDIFQG